jgi:hypothetical protein
VTKPSVLLVACWLACVCCVTIGVALWSVPAALVVFGVLCAVLAALVLVDVGVER